MFKTIRRVVLRLLATLATVLVVVLVALNLTWNFFARETTTTDYSDWMGETLADDRLVIDVAMLGAHDAFSSDIRWTSPVDPLSADAIQTGVTGALIKGFSVKQSKTQMSATATLLARGVRYFDVRLTYSEDEGAWYATHSYFSRPWAEDLAAIEAFLAEHPGEFVIIDVQHVYGVDYDDADDFASVRTALEASGLLDRAVPRDVAALDALDYDDVTFGHTKGGVLLFSKFTTDDPCFWAYGASIRSAWPNTDDPATAFAFLDAERDAIGAGEALTGNQIPGYVGVDSRHGLRVMQGVLTMQMDGEGILAAIGGWSLVARARGFNVHLVGQDGFASWLAAMPIVMVDYADSNAGGFNDAVMEAILLYDTGVPI